MASAIAVSGKLMSLVITGEIAPGYGTARFRRPRARRCPPNSEKGKSGYRPEHTLTFGINPAYDNEARLKQFYERLLASLRSTTGIEAVGGATLLPPDDPFHSTISSVRKAPEQVTDASQPTPFRIVSSDYFRAMGISILEGREFTASDSELNCIVVSESLASRFWPGLLRLLAAVSVSRAGPNDC